MTVERGVPWGRSAPLPSDGLVVGSDAAASDAAAAEGKMVKVSGEINCFAE